MAQKVTENLPRLSKIEEIRGVTEELDVALGYAILGGLAHEQARFMR